MKIKNLNLTMWIAVQIFMASGLTPASAAVPAPLGMDQQPQADKPFNPAATQASAAPMSKPVDTMAAADSPLSPVKNGKNAAQSKKPVIKPLTQAEIDAKNALNPTQYKSWVVLLGMDPKKFNKYQMKNLTDQQAKIDQWKKKDAEFWNNIK